MNECLDESMNNQTNKQEKPVCTYLFNTAHGLKIDIITFPRHQRWVPEALISSVVTNCESCCFWKIARRQFCSKIIGRAIAQGILICDRNLVAIHWTGFSFGPMRMQLFNNNLIGAVQDQERKNARMSEYMTV